MKKLTPEEFIACKKSDTLVVLGSGSSINLITDKQWDQIRQWDSIGFNWFCHHPFGPTFFVIREQSNISSRNRDTETRERLFKDLNKKSYANTCLIVHDISHHSPKTFSWVEPSRLRKFPQNGIVVRDIKARLSRKLLTCSIFEKGVVHGSCSLTNVLHIGLFLQYKRIYFVGVDLGNSRYFWLKGNRTRSSIRSKGRKYSSKHPVAGPVLIMVRMIKKNFNPEMLTANRKSLLTRVIPFREI